MAAETATALGIASFGIQVCQSLVSYYDGWKDYPSDISDARDSIVDLLKTFELLSDCLKKPQLRASSVARVGDSMTACKSSLTKLESELTEMKKHKDPKGFREKARAEIQRAWYPFRKETLTRLRGITDELKQNLALALHVLQIDLGSSTKETLDDVATVTKDTAGRTVAIEASLAKISEQAQRIEDTQQSEQWKKICNWLSAPDPWTNHDSHRKRHEAQTGTWVLRSERYVRWKAGDIQYLWLYGKAGCGKSVLCSTLVEDIRAHCKTLRNAGCGVFYFTFSDNQKQSYPNLLRSLVAQLGWKEPGLSMLVQACRKDTPRPEELEKALIASLECFDEVFILLDALDECPEAEETRQSVLEGLEGLIQRTRNIRMLITSRDVSEVREFMETIQSGVVSISTASVNEDIRKWMSSQLLLDRKLSKLDGPTKTLIENTTSKKADGMFRWAYCQLQELKKLKSTKPKYVEHALTHLPTTLDATYERMLTSIEDMYQDEALACLQWLAFSEGPLTLVELAEAAIIDPEGDGAVDIANRGTLEGTLEILGALVVVQQSMDEYDSEYYDSDDYESDDGETDGETLSSESFGKRLDGRSEIRLAHFSVKEYLESERILKNDAKTFYMESAKTHRFLAQSCLTYLIHYSNSERKERGHGDLKEFPLLKYAARSWYYHSSLQCGEVGRESDLLNSEEIRLDWLAVEEPGEPLHHPFERRKDTGSGLYYACYLRLQAVVEELLKAGCDVNIQGGHYGNALQVASRGGFVETMKILIDRGADVNAAGGHYGHALQVASAKGHKNAAKMLICAGADINAQGGDSGSAITAASRYGYANIVEMLISAGADVNTRNYRDETALHLATIGGSTEIVKKLLRTGADANARNKWDETALHLATRRGHTEIVEKLLRTGADVNARNFRDETALELATLEGHTEIVEKLLRTGADVNARNKWNGTALHLATDKGKTEIVEKLLRAGADVNARNLRDYETALHWATRYGRVEIVKKLLRVGADVNAKTSGDETALELATCKGYTIIVEQLLRAGATPISSS